MKSLEPLEIPLVGTRLVEASAGTGKTFTIALLYVRLVMEQGLGADQILVVTYTRAAAAELRERIRVRLQEVAQALENRLVTAADLDRGPHSMLPEIVDASIERGRPAEELERLRNALRGFDEAAISTIHGFCQRMLDENAFESGVAFGTDLVADQRALVDDVVADFWTRSLYDAEPAFVEWLRDARLAGEPVRPPLFVGLADTVARHPGIVVRPEAPPEGRADLDGRLAALDRVRALWGTVGAEALECLAKAAEQKDLNRNAFRPDAIRTKWASEIEAYLDRPAIGGAGATRSGSRVERRGLARLTRSRVEASANKGRVAPSHALFDAAEVLVEADEQVADAFARRLLALELELIGYTRAELGRRRRASRTRSFDELLTALADALDGPGGSALASGIRARFPAALIDEFQDTDPVQYSIFRNVWRDTPGSFFLIGDPKQAIYGFRGADVFAYMQAKIDAGPDTVSLARNWRSDPSVIAGVNALFSSVPSPFLYDAIPFQPARPAPEASDRLDADDGPAGLRILFVSRDEKGKPIGKGRAKPLVSAAVADHIATLLASGATIDEAPLTASDVAVLCRTNDQARAVQVQLRRRGVPSVMQTQQSVFETDEAAALERILAAAAEPGHAAAIRAAITTSWVGVGAARLQAIDADPSGLDPWLEEAETWSACLRSTGALALVEHVLHARGTRERVLAEIDGERRLTNLLHLAELMQTSSGAGPTMPRSQLRWLSRMRRDAAARADQAGEDAIIRLESDARAVSLVTIHRSKGLQYGVVYCPFLWDGRLLARRDETWVRFHDPEASHRLTLDLGSASHAENLARSRYEAFAESLRLLYVALTRARHRVVVAWGAVAKGQPAALGFLLHPPDDADALVASRDPALVEACAAGFEKQDDDALRADLKRLVDRSDGAIAVEPLVAPPVARGAIEPIVGPLHPARTLDRRISQRRRVSSFSRLAHPDVAMAGRALGGLAALPNADTAALPNADMAALSSADFAASPNADIAASANAHPVALPDEHPAAAGRDYDATPEPVGAVLRGPVDEGEPVGLHAFPAGAGPGTLIHGVLERLDFGDRSSAVLESLCERALGRTGLAPGLAPTLAAGLRDALDTPLGGPLGEFRLADLDRAARIDEMEFALPVGLGADAALTPARLAEAFSRHAASPDVAAYAERVATIGFPALTGHLRGFVDLIFRQAGRYYVVDYKSNRLGPYANDYAPERLAGEMVRHDYTLQYHLYAVALHRLLAQRLGDYSPAQHFGGVYYLFLRGMSPVTGPATGVFHDRPPDALIDALSTTLGGGSGGRGEEGRA